MHGQLFTDTYGQLTATQSFPIMVDLAGMIQPPRDVFLENCPPVHVQSQGGGKPETIPGMAMENNSNVPK